MKLVALEIIINHLSSMLFVQIFLMFMCEELFLSYRGLSVWKELMTPGTDFQECFKGSWNTRLVARHIHYSMEMSLKILVEACPKD